MVALATSTEIDGGALDDCGWDCGRESGWAAGEPAAAQLAGLRPGVSLEQMEKQLVAMTLDATGGNRSRAAELLGVSLRTVRNKVRSYGLPSWSSYGHD